MNAMTIVLLAVAAIAAVMGFGMRNNGNNEFASLMYAIVYVIVFTLMAYALYRKKIVIKL